MFRTHTEATIEAVTRTIVNIKNRPMSGTSSDVGGMSFDMRSRKTVSARSTEIHRDIFSPDSEGRTKTKIARLVINMHGMIKLTV